MNLDQLTYAINGAVYEVSRILGPGFLERVYENALLVELQGEKASKHRAKHPFELATKKHWLETILLISWLTIKWSLN
jgi:GxxExxY protein